MVKLVIFNELSNARNPNNMQVLHTVLQHSPEQAPKVKLDRLEKFQQKWNYFLINSAFNFIFVLAVLGNGVPGPVNQ